MACPERVANRRESVETPELLLGRRSSPWSLEDAQNQAQTHPRGIPVTRRFDLAERGHSRPSQGYRQAVGRSGNRPRCRGDAARDPPRIEFIAFRMAAALG